MPEDIALSANAVLEHGSFSRLPREASKHSLTPSADNPARPLQRSNPNGMKDELLRHVREDSRMSSFEFGIQLLDAGKMTYWGSL